MHVLLVLLIMIVALWKGGYDPWATLVLELGVAGFALRFTSRSYGMAMTKREARSRTAPYPPHSLLKSSTERDIVGDVVRNLRHSKEN